MQFQLRRVLIAVLLCFPVALGALWIGSGYTRPIFEGPNAARSPTAAADDEPDPADGSRRTLRGHTDGVYAVAISPDAKCIATGGRDRTIKLWDIETEKLIRTLEGHDGMVLRLAFSPDGTTLASGGEDQTIKIWDVATGRETATLKGHRNWVCAVSFSPDGRRLASASADSTVKLWDLATSATTATLRGHQDEVWTVEFSPDGAQLASGGKDRTVRIWDAASAEQLGVLDRHNGEVYTLAYTRRRHAAGIGEPGSHGRHLGPGDRGRDRYFVRPRGRCLWRCFWPGRNMAGDRQRRHDFPHLGPRQRQAGHSAEGTSKRSVRGRNASQLGSSRVGWQRSHRPHLATAVAAGERYNSLNGQGEGSDQSVLRNSAGGRRAVLCHGFDVLRNDAAA